MRLWHITIGDIAFLVSVPSLFLSGFGIKDMLMSLNERDSSLSFSVLGNNLYSGDYLFHE